MVLDVDGVGDWDEVKGVGERLYEEKSWSGYGMIVSSNGWGRGVWGGLVDVVDVVAGLCEMGGWGRVG